MQNRPRNAFECPGRWNYANESAWNAMIYGVHNASSSNYENVHNNLLELSEGPASDNNDTIGQLVFIFVRKCNKKINKNSVIKIEMKKFPLSGTGCDFLVDHNTIAIEEF